MNSNTELSWGDLFDMRFENTIDAKRPGVELSMSYYVVQTSDAPPLYKVYRDGVAILYTPSLDEALKEYNKI